MYIGCTYLQVAMKTLLRDIGTWILMHPRLVSVLVFVALTAFALVVLPDSGIARRRWKP